MASLRPVPASNSATTRAFVQWIRSAAPYIHALRGKTLVIAFGGEVVADETFLGIIHDLNLLHSLGVRLVVVHGSRPQIEAILRTLDELDHPFREIRVYTPTPLDAGTYLPAGASNVVVPTRRSSAFWEQVDLPRAHGARTWSHPGSRSGGRALGFASCRSHHS